MIVLDVDMARRRLAERADAKVMRSPSHLSSSTFSTGKLVAARASPPSRRVASARPSRAE